MPPPLLEPMSQALGNQTNVNHTRYHQHYSYNDRRTRNEQHGSVHGGDQSYHTRLNANNQDRIGMTQTDTLRSRSRSRSRSRTRSTKIDEQFLCLIVFVCIFQFDDNFKMI
eukprot:5708_1